MRARLPVLLLLTTGCVQTSLVAPGELDEDGDGYGVEEDCDDTDAAIWPGAPEVAEDGVDQDCDGVDSLTSFGHRDQAGSLWTVADFIVGVQVEVSNPLVVEGLGVDLTQADGNLRLGLYEQVAGFPAALLAGTEATASVEGEQLVDVVEPVLIEPGTYWVQVLVDADVTLAASESELVTLTYSDQLFVDGLPDPYGFATDYEDFRPSFWVEGSLPD